MIRMGRVFFFPQVLIIEYDRSARLSLQEFNHISGCSEHYVSHPHLSDKH